MKKIVTLSSLMLFIIPTYIFGETWNCITEAEQEIYSYTKHVRGGENFKLYVNESYEGLDRIIEENEREIILYYEAALESFITILHKKKKTIVTYNSSGNNPNEALPPGFGSCEVTD